MDLLKLRNFIVIAECKNFSKAAERLFTTQPTLSRHMAELEDELGVLLFLRKSHSITLTDAGEILFNEAKMIIKACDELKPKLHQIQVFPPLLIGYPIYVFHDVLNIFTETIKSISKKYPQAEITIQRKTVETLNKALKNGTIDLIISAPSLVRSIPKVTWIKIYSNKLQVVVPEKHMLASKRSIQISDLVDEDFIMYDRNSNPAAFDNIMALCIRNKFSPNIKHTAEDSMSILLTVAAEKGVTFLSAHNAEQNVKGVKFLDVEGEDMDLDVVLAYIKDNQNPMLPLFINEFKNLQ